MWILNNCACENINKNSQQKENDFLSENTSNLHSCIVDALLQRKIIKQQHFIMNA